MIKNITDLRYYHESDRLACNKSAKVSLRERILSFLFVVQDCPSLIMVLLLFQVKLRLDVTVEFIHAST